MLNNFKNEVYKFIDFIKNNALNILYNNFDNDYKVYYKKIIDYVINDLKNDLESNIFESCYDHDQEFEADDLTYFFGTPKINDYWDYLNKYFFDEIFDDCIKKRIIFFDEIAEKMQEFIINDVIKNIFSIYKKGGY